MDSRLLHQFLNLADALHFGKASEASHVSPSALSRSIQQLEAEIGVALFDRDNRSVALTHEGKLFLPYAREALAEWDADPQHPDGRGRRTARRSEHVLLGHGQLQLPVRDPQRVSPRPPAYRDQAAYRRSGACRRTSAGRRGRHSDRCTARGAAEWPRLPADHHFAAGVHRQQGSSAIRRQTAGRQRR